MQPIGPLVCPVLVGRDDLVDLAQRRLTEARAGRGRILFLAGEAGVGKTRLLGVIERAAAAAGIRTIVRGAAFPRDLDVPAAAFEDLARVLQRDRVLGELGQRLASRLADEAAVPGDAHRRRRLLSVEVAGLLEELGRGGPAVLSLEDVHWADDLTLEILAMLARRLPELPILVLATYRSDELYPRVPMRDWRARLLSGRLAEEVRLGRLVRDQTERMVEALMEQPRPAPAALVDVIHARADGIPLHVEELVGAMLAAGAAQVGAAGAGAVVPETLEAAILERLARRSDAAQELAGTVAVIGRSFGLELAIRVAGGDDDVVGPPLAELIEHFFLVPAEGPQRFDFRHALIRDAIYRSVPPIRRRALHGRIADIAGTEGLLSDADLSVHLEEAGRSAEAYARAFAAARAAKAINAHREAIVLYGRALLNRPADLGLADLAALHEAHGEAAMAVDENELAAAELERAVAAYRDAGLPVRAADVSGTVVAARHLLGDPLEARVERLESAIAELRADGPGGPDAEAVEASLEAGLSAAYMLDRRLEESIGHGEAALQLAARTGVERAELNAMATLGSDYVFAGRMADGWQMLDQAVERARAAHLEAEAARAYRMAASSASVLVEYERAERQLREGIDYAERVELWNHRHYLTAHLGHVMWATGRWAEAESTAAHALADGRGGITTRITALHVLGYVALGRGDVRSAASTLDEARTLSEGMRELQRLSPALWGLAEVALRSGAADKAIAWSERGRAASAAVGDAAYLFPFLVTGVRAHLAAHDVGGAERWLANVADQLRHRAIPGTLPAIDHGAGLVALAGGATGRARDLLNAAVAAWDERGRIWEGTWARIDLASCHLRANRPADARREASEAGRIAATLPSPPLRAAADAVLERVRVRHPDEPLWAPLTAREFEVARRIAAGATNPQVAADLGIAPKTVSAHVEHILAKLGVGRRAEIAAWVGALDQPDSEGRSSDR